MCPNLVFSTSLFLLWLFHFGYGCPQYGKVGSEDGSILFAFPALDPLCTNSLFPLTPLAYLKHANFFQKEVLLVNNIREIKKIRVAEE